MQTSRQVNFSVSHSNLQQRRPQDDQQRALDDLLAEVALLVAGLRPGAAVTAAAATAEKETARGYEHGQEDQDRHHEQHAPVIFQHFGYLNVLSEGYCSALHGDQTYRKKLYCHTGLIY